MGYERHYAILQLKGHAKTLAGRNWEMKKRTADAALLRNVD